MHSNSISLGAYCKLHYLQRPVAWYVMHCEIKAAQIKPPLTGILSDAQAVHLPNSSYVIHSSTGEGHT